MMQNYIIWNVRWANNLEFRRHFKSIVNIHQPFILVFLETRMTDHKKLADELGFPCYI